MGCSSSLDRRRPSLTAIQRITRSAYALLPSASVAQAAVLPTDSRAALIRVPFAPRSAGLLAVGRSAGSFGRALFELPAGGEQPLRRIALGVTPDLEAQARLARRAPTDFELRPRTHGRQELDRA